MSILSNSIVSRTVGEGFGVEKAGNPAKAGRFSFLNSECDFQN